MVTINVASITILALLFKLLYYIINKIDYLFANFTLLYIVPKNVISHSFNTNALLSIPIN